MLSIVKSVDDPVHREWIVNRIQSKDNGVRQGSCEQDMTEQKHLIGSFLINLFFFPHRNLRMATRASAHKVLKGRVVRTRR